MNKRKTKFNEDTDGVSLLTSLGIIIIIGLLSWQFLLPMVDDSIPSITELISNDAIEPEDIDSDFYIANPLTLLKKYPVDSPHNYAYGDTYKLILESNIPYKFMDKYYIDIAIWDNGTLVSRLTEAVPYTAIWSNQFTYNLLIDTTQFDTTWTIQIIFLDGSYNRIHDGMPFNQLILLPP